MSNISVTLSCRRKCGCCFTQGLSVTPKDMTVGTFSEALAFLKRSGLKTAPVLGGEPTVHPSFSHLIDLVEESGLALLLFTGGQAPPGALRRLERFPAERLSILLNADPASLPLQPEERGMRSLLELFGPAVTLGCNIWHPGISPAPLLKMIADFGLAHTIRLGLAHPSPGGENRHLHPRRYRAAGAGLGPFIIESLKRGIRLEFDCGFVPCMFSPDVYELLAALGDPPGARCNPLPDFLPSGELIPCYPLGRVCRTTCQPEDTVSAVQARLSKGLSAYAGIGIYSECRNCPVRERALCSGGCRAAALARLRPSSVEGFSQNSQSSLSSGAARQEACLPLKTPPPEAALSLSVSSASPGAAPDDPAVAAASAAGPGAAPKIPSRELWTIPYIDQPLPFWHEVRERFGPAVEAVYLPLPSGAVPSGRPLLKGGRLQSFLSGTPFPVSALINSIVLPRPSSALVSAVVRALKSLESATRLSGAVIADFGLGKAVKESLPHLKLTASVLMDVHKPVQAGELSGVFDAIVAASRIMRDLKALEDLKKSFPGVLRIITNEGCLPGCLMRSQHFYEMAYSKEFPASLCEPLLAEHPWLRLTGAWVLPQHLHFYSGITSHFKLAGRAALQDPERYLEVLGAYVERRPLAPDAIGGGPASPLSPVSISPDFFLKTLNCDKNCFACHVCRNRYELSAFAPSAAAPASGP